MAIDRLNQGTPSQASQLPFYDPANGQDRRASLAEVAAVLAPLLQPQSGQVTQYAAPTATGFSVTVAPPTAGVSMFLLLSQSAGYAAGTIALPVGLNEQTIIVHSRQSVTTLTITPATGQTVSGAPTTLAAGSFFALRFDAINQLWCRVG
jgi:hypothetical protein